VGYLNGQLATGTYEGSVAATTLIDTAVGNDITLGGWSTDSSRPFRGALDEVHLYPRALTAEEVAALASVTPETNAASAWFFRNTGLTASTADDWQADSDGDGLTAWQEYALGGNPNLASTAVRPSLDSVARTFTFNRRRSGIAASRYVAEYSPDLTEGSWTPLANPTVIDHPSDPQLQKVSLPVPAGEKGFVRLSLGQAPE
ncbi:MAG: hypothetical protein JWO82_4240, partial [Akkermansiaceae bacterium]|nr:hypothetical protein [Akkermansiaceae bacterium]